MRYVAISKRSERTAQENGMAKERKAGRGRTPGQPGILPRPIWSIALYGADPTDDTLLEKLRTRVVESIWRIHANNGSGKTCQHARSE